MEYLKKFVAEMLGSFILIYICCSTATITQLSNLNMSSQICTALACGMTMAGLYTVFKSVTGAHLNTAVSLAMVLDGRIKFLDFIIYIIAQFAGAIGGAMFLKYITGPVNTYSFCLNYIYDGNLIRTGVLEIALTAIFVLVFLSVTKKEDSMNGFYIGAALTAVELSGLGFDGASLNPFKTLATSITFGADAFANFKDMIPFLAGPLFGGLIAWIVYQLFKPHVAKKKTENEDDIDFVKKEDEKPRKHRKTEPEEETKPKRKKKEKNLSKKLTDLIFEAEEEDEEEEEYEEPVRQQPRRTASTQTPQPASHRKDQGAVQAVRKPRPRVIDAEDDVEQVRRPVRSIPRVPSDIDRDESPTIAIPRPSRSRDYYDDY